MRRSLRSKVTKKPITTGHGERNLRRDPFSHVKPQSPYMSSFLTRAFHGRERDSTGQRRLIPDETKADYYCYRAYELTVWIVRTLRVEFRIAPEGPRRAEEACSRVQRRKCMQRLPQEHLQEVHSFTLPESPVCAFRSCGERDETPPTSPLIEW
jgi:hypothetical protein